MSPVRQAHRGGPKKDRWTVKPQRKPQTPETHKAALVSGRRMNAEDWAEHKERLRKHPLVDRKPTRKDVANTFKGYKERITEKLNALAYSPDARSLAREYVTFQQVIDHARGYCPDGPALPEMPALIGNDYYAGMIRLADYCTMAADVLDGRKALDGEGRGNWFLNFLKGAYALTVEKVTKGIFDSATKRP